MPLPKEIIDRINDEAENAGYIKNGLVDMCDEDVEDAYIQAATRYASHMIGFAEWINKEGYQEYDGSDRWISPTQSRKVFTTPELLTMYFNYLNEKG